MFKIDIEYLGEIPANSINMKGVEYFLVVDTYDMGIIGLPNIDPTSNPFRIGINKKKVFYTENRLAEFNPQYTILSPIPNMEVINNDMMVSLSYFQMDNIDNTKTQVFINEEDISSDIDFRFNHFVYYPKSISAGIKNIRVILVDDFGIEYNPIEWSFTVIKEEDISLLSLRQSGKLKTDYSSSFIDTTEFKENTIDFIYNAKFDWLDFRLNTHLSSLDNSDLKSAKNLFLGCSKELSRDDKCVLSLKSSQSNLAL
jgi:hypothetical protein